MSRNVVTTLFILLFLVFLVSCVQTDGVEENVQNEELTPIDNDLGDLDEDFLSINESELDALDEDLDLLDDLS